MIRKVKKMAEKNEVPEGFKNDFAVILQAFAAEDYTYAGYIIAHLSKQYLNWLLGLMRPGMQEVSLEYKDKTILHDNSDLLKDFVKLAIMLRGYIEIEIKT